MWKFAVIGLVCLSGLSYAQDDVQQAPQRSCDLNRGAVCIPTACSSTNCSLWKDAVCVDDRCGCEARFFNWMSKEKTFHNVSKMCSSGNFVINDVQQAPQRSCDLNRGAVCIPTACSSTNCSLWKDAVCVDDRCGCEARFFNWMSKEKTFHDVSKMCSSGNFVMNFINFTTASEKDEEVPSDATRLRYFREFNLLTTEVLIDITDYLKSVSESSPTRTNIEKLLLARRTLSSLKRVAGLVNDEEADKVNLDSVKKNHRVAVAVMQDILNENGSFADAVASGKVAISDKNVQNELKTAFLGRIIKCPEGTPSHIWC